MKTDQEQRHDSRSKVVSFRVSDNEYDSAMALCRLYGYRGMSGLARSAFLAFNSQMDSNFQKSNYSTDHPELAQQQISSLLEELNHLISSLSGLREALPDRSE